ncbi:MAG TPA: T9SS type A sorting domain-containing protein, partial [Bacteroidales bacterium]|nr:T9SS type A sorting domain-containing protein [Bacteroidales bacterium]
RLTRASVDFRNVVFLNNTSYSGGAVAADEHSSPYFFNCIFNGNKATNYGGAARFLAVAELVNCVFYDNSTFGRGGAIDHGGTSGFSRVSNSIAWQNTAGSSYPNFFAVEARNCLVEGGYEAGSSILSAEPLFLNSERGDFRLNALSPAINAGSINHLPGGSLTDFAGNDRVLGTQVDLGVFEGGKLTPVIESPAHFEIVSPGQAAYLLTWAWPGARDPDAGQLRVEYRINDAVASYSHALSAETVDYELSDLGPADRIVCRLEVETSSGDSYFSPPSTFYVGRGHPLYVKPTGSGNGSSWSDASSLQGALDAAVFGDQIWLAAGVYVPASGSGRGKTFRVKDGIQLYGGFVGSETLLSQRNPQQNQSILSGGLGDPLLRTDNAYHVLTLKGTAGAPLTEATLIDGLVIEEGYANYGVNTNGEGGGLYVEHASPTVRNTVFRNNYAEKGGAVSVRGNSTPRFGNVLFIGNEVKDHGGAFYTDASCLFYNSLWIGNNAGRMGGSIYGEPGNSSKVYNSIFRNNTSGGLGTHFRNVSVSSSFVEGESGASIQDLDPLFLDESNHDFRLNFQSPALDAGIGVPEWLDKDFSGKSRRIGDAVDIGPYEGPSNTVYAFSPANGKVMEPEEAGVRVAWKWHEHPPEDVLDYVLIYSINNGPELYLENLTQLDVLLPGVQALDRVTWRIYSRHSNGSRRWSAPASFRVSRGHPLYVKPNGTGSGRSWQDASSLQDALSMAIESDVLWLATGVYYATTDNDREVSFSLMDGLKIYGGFNGTEEALEERNWARFPVVISGDIGVPGDVTDNTKHLFSIIGSDERPIIDLHLDGLIFEKAHSNNAGGGGLLLEYASPIISNSWFRQHVSNGSGAAVLADSNSEPVFANVLFTNNESGLNGGAVAASGVVKFYHCLWYNNKAAYFGGGLNGQFAMVYNSISWNNIAGYGGNHFQGAAAYYCLVQGGYDLGGNNFQGEPAFLNPENDDFRLKSSSSAMDAGLASHNPLWLVSDFLGQDRVQGSKPDLGPFEGGFDLALNAPSATFPLHGHVFGEEEEIKVQWDWYPTTPEGIVSYDVEYRINSDVFQVLTGIEQKEQILINLKPGDEVLWRVRAHTLDTALDWSSYFQFNISNTSTLADERYHDLTFQIWPNPIRLESERLTLKVPEGQEGGCLQLIDLSGRLIFGQQLEGAGLQNPTLPALSPGVYLLRYQSESGFSDVVRLHVK